MKAWARNLLCIDDDSTILQVETLLLEARGYSVVAAASGRDGLEKFASQPFDLVLLDYEMPDLNGAKVAAEMKRLKPHVPILMHSGQGYLPDACRQLVDGFVAKGTAYSAIAEKIEQLCLLREPARDVAPWGAAHV